MKSTRLIAILLCLFSINTWANITSPNNAKIQQILNNWRASSGIPSATLSILTPDQTKPITFTSGTIDYTKREKPNADTLFQAGSITKSFTSTIILQLEAEGKLNINDPITKYLPQYPRWSTVTIRQLLNHTSGIFNYTETSTFNTIRKTHPQAELSPEQLVQMVATHRGYFSPGAGWKYSNTNYVLAGMIIQKVMGQSIEKVMNHYLHGGGWKVKLLNTYYHARIYTASLVSKMAHGYSSEGRDVTTDNMSWAYTAGAIVSTTEDLLTWWHGLFQGHILPPRQLMQMTSLVCEKPSPSCRPGMNMPHLTSYEHGKGYGLGVIQSSYGSSKIGPVWWHNGSTKGYKAIVMWFPEYNIYMALTINRDPGYLLKPDLPAIQKIMRTLIA
jgi:D-alanyl-D-alanine carboxypeptidase